jgi:hypothetical protein
MISARIAMAAPPHVTTMATPGPTPEAIAESWIASSRYSSQWRRAGFSASCPPRKDPDRFPRSGREFLRRSRVRPSYANLAGAIVSVDIDSVPGPLVVQPSQPAEQAALLTVIALGIIFGRAARSRNRIGARLNLDLPDHGAPNLEQASAAKQRRRQSAKRPADVVVDADFQEQLRIVDDTVEQT